MPPHEADDLLVSKVISVTKRVRQLFAIHLARIDVIPGQDEFLLALDKEPLQSTGQISNKLRVRPSTVSKMVDILMRKGWVARTASTKDARVTHLRLTEEGVAVCEQIRTVWGQIEAELKPTGKEKELRSLFAMDAHLTKRLRRLR